MPRLAGGGMNGSTVFVYLKGAMPLCNPKGGDPSGCLRDNVPQREVKPRPLGGELHFERQYRQPPEGRYFSQYIFEVKRYKKSFFIEFWSNYSL